MYVSLNMEYLAPLCERAKDECDKYAKCAECPEVIFKACDKVIDVALEVAHDDKYSPALEKHITSDFANILQSLDNLERSTKCKGNCTNCNCATEFQCKKVDLWTEKAKSVLTELLNEFEKAKI